MTFYFFNFIIIIYLFSCYSIFIIKYWSEKENGKEYNLNLPITRNLTLYSVYEINKYNVEFYDSNKLIKTIKVDYDNTINITAFFIISYFEYNFLFSFILVVKSKFLLFSIHPVNV